MINSQLQWPLESSRNIEGVGPCWRKSIKRDTPLKGVLPGITSSCLLSASWLQGGKQLSSSKPTFLGGCTLKWARNDGTKGPW